MYKDLEITQTGIKNTVYDDNRSFVHTINYNFDNIKYGQEYLYYNSNIVFKYNYNNGVLEGDQYQWFINTQVLAVKFTMNYGKLHGKYIEYWIDGSVKSITSYLENLKHGLQCLQKYDTELDKYTNKISLYHYDTLIK